MDFFFLFKVPYLFSNFLNFDNSTISLNSSKLTSFLLSLVVVPDFLSSFKISSDANVFAKRTDNGYNMILNPIFCNVDAELIGVAPPSIILATSGALIDLPIFLAIFDLLETFLMPLLPLTL